jgi:transposase
MMKLQDVILKAMAKKLSWIAAAEIAGMSVRNMQRKRQGYVEHGYDGLFDQRRGKRSMHRVPMETAERVLALYQEKYCDFNVRHFHEKLREEEGIRLSYSWVRQALQGAGLVARRRRRIAGGGKDERCRACCCTLTAANTAGFRMTAGST